LTERNALAGGLAEKAEDWRFGGLFNWLGGHCGIKLVKWPIPRLPIRLERVNRVVSEKEAEQLKRCITRGQAFGDAGWVETTARQYNLESTLKKRGRPNKFTHTTN